MADHVLILGGGVGGMSAAHELAERGFEVTVVEDRAMPGGKARSIPVPDSGTEGREPLPAEHGFRFFPGFYQHLPDTMKRIPFANQADGVFGNLRQATEAQILQVGGKAPVRLPVRFPHSTSDVHEIVRDMVHPDWGLTAGDIVHFTERLLVLLTSCEARRYGEWEQQSWWEFSGAESRSPAYQRFLAEGLTRTLVAAQAREMSARTGGYILLQLLFDIGGPGRQADRVLNGPTNDAWIFPWLAHLRSLGVDYRLETRVEEIESDGPRVTGVVVTGPDGNRTTLTADWYISAVPVEHMDRLSTPALREAEPALDSLHKLRTRWMNGLLFYLRNDVPLVHGHVIYIDSPWSLTSISQRQFWDRDLSAFGEGDVGGILSVDVSDWTRPGLLTDKPAMECSHDEIIADVWAQLKAHLAGGEVALDDDNLVRSFLDEDVRFPDLHDHHGVRRDVNLEPLLVNTAGSWAWRPEVDLGIENLFLASDYVRTHTDLATMEGANEAARRAVNLILEHSGSAERPCELWPLHEPEVFAPARKLDAWRYERGHGHELPEDVEVPSTP